VTFKSWRLASKRKTTKNPKLAFSQVEMFPPTFFPDWAIRMMLHGQKVLTLFHPFKFQTFKFKA